MALAKVQARYLMAGGLGLTGVGLLLMGGLSMDSEWTALLLGFIVGGIGIGLLNPVIADVALSVVPKEKSGMAAGINDTFRQVGVAVGIAAWGAIFLGFGASKVESLAGGAVDHDQARGLVEATSSGALPQALRALPADARDTARNAAEQGFLHGLNEILMLGGILCLVGTGFALWLVREREIDRGEIGAGTDVPARGRARPGRRLTPPSGRSQFPRIPRVSANARGAG